MHCEEMKPGQQNKYILVLEPRGVTKKTKFENQKKLRGHMILVLCINKITV